ncbi:MAG: glycosyl hydrolase-related protein, partial [Anaerolineae bacterium]
PDQGLHRFSYALYPHTGDWRLAHTDRRAAEFNQPLVASLTTAHMGAIVPGKELINCSAPNAMITSVKCAESGENALIVRVVEMHGLPATAKLHWAWKVRKVEQVNPVEEHSIDLTAQSDGVDIPLLKHEIITLKLHLS